MKKLAILLGLLVFAVFSYGQNIADKGVKGDFDYNFKVNQRNPEQNITYTYFYGNEVTDTLDASDSWNRDYSILNLTDALKHECRVELDSISGSPTVTVTLEGKYSYNDSYTSIAAATWDGTSADTTIALQGTTAKPYRFLNVKVVATADTQKLQVERIELGIFK